MLIANTASLAIPRSSLIMLSRLGARLWHHLSSAHLNQAKSIPVVPLFFTDRKLVVTPILKALPQEQTISFSFIPQPALPVPIPPVTRFPEEEKKLLPEVKYSRATRKRINVSVKKMNEVCLLVRKMHVLDALATLQDLKQKCAPWLSGMIRSAIYNGVVHKGLDGERLYISQVILGKNRPAKGRRYAARGRAYPAIKPYSQVTVILEERSVEDFYKLIVTGHYSPTLARILRNKFLTENVDLDTVRRYQNLLTAKGRQQQRLMFRRKVLKLVGENKARGVYVSQETAEKKILEDESKEFAEKYWANKRRFAEEKIAARQSIYQKNEGL